MIKSRSRSAVRFWIEVALGGLSAALLAITIVWPDWIERVFAIEPDGGNGSVEWGWGWAIVLAVATLVCCLDAGRTWWQTLRGAPASK